MFSLAVPSQNGKPCPYLACGESRYAAEFISGINVSIQPRFRLPRSDAETSAYACNPMDEISNSPRVTQCSRHLRIGLSIAVSGWKQVRIESQRG